MINLITKFKTQYSNIFMIIPNISLDWTSVKNIKKSLPKLGVASDHTVQSNAAKNQVNHAHLNLLLHVTMVTTVTIVTMVTMVTMKLHGEFYTE